MTLKTETIQKPVEVDYFECNKCNKRIENLDGMMEARWYQDNPVKNALIDLMMPHASPDVRNQFANVPRASASGVVHHLCRSCSESYQIFVNNGKFNEFMEAVRSIAVKMVLGDTVGNNELMDAFLKYPGTSNVTHPKQSDSGKRVEM